MERPPIEAEVRYIELEPHKAYRIIPLGDRWDFMRLHRTLASIDSFQKNGNPVTLVVPERHLTSEELEKLRSFYCSYAKKIKRNCVYFEGDIALYEEDPE